ncbi:proline iminopeptidase-family hydrolase [Massilia oculi]|uniref:Proline iminopeptidase n=1 Tax=Massilia oculi TaxID=945844 RepID=A0A2S2DG58_9BURK|nr:proline iminopeptidase-family hydrolase [Massilia oculi]AWL04314.1 proline iminopeptidase [Massilia oculi]
MKNILIACLLAGLGLASASAAEPSRQEQQLAKQALPGVRMIPIHTPKGDFKVWTRRMGDNPTVKVLLLHGGPGSTHEYFKTFDDHFPGASIEYYYYDQLGSWFSDQPDDPSLNTVERFTDEVEQVRKALGLDKDNFYLLGHSWGGILAIEYALAHPGKLKGLVISNMMASAPAYNAYAQNVLAPQIDPAVLAEVRKLEAEGKTDDPRYMELLIPHFYERHILRRPLAELPEPVLRSFGHLNQKIYKPMQGPSELGISGLLANWDRFDDLERIDVPTLVVGARYDTMDPAHMKKMAQRLPQGQFLYCENGSHMAMYDDAGCYFDGLLKFLRGAPARTAVKPRSLRSY